MSPETMKPAYLFAGDDETKVDETTLVLRARGKAPPQLVKAGEAAHGQVTMLRGRGAPELPGWAAEEAAKRGLKLDRAAPGLLVGRMSANRVHVGNEMDRLAPWP